MKVISDNGMIAEAHRFDGSTSHLVALKTWFDTGEYVAPAVRTRDYRSGEVGRFIVSPGDWFIRSDSGEHTVMRDRDFAKFYREV